MNKIFRFPLWITLSGISNFCFDKQNDELVQKKEM